MGTDAKQILAALKSGAISIEDAASEITKTRRQAQAHPKAGTPASADMCLQSIPGGYHKVIIERPGSIDDIKIVDARPQALAPHEVRIAVKAFSLNFADLLCTRGLYPNMPPYPFTPGLEVAGIVAGVGDAVQTFTPGDPVVAMSGTGMGGHATQVTCLSEQVFHKPESLSFEDACSLPVVAITMMVAFDKARLQWGERILIQTATGGTGLMAVQLAKYYGAEIYATAGSDHKLRYLERLDVPHRINYLETDFEAEIHRLTRGKGVDVVINTLPGDAIQKGLNCLSAEGRYIELAMTGIKSAKTIDLSKLTSNQTFYSIDPGRLKRKEVIRDHFNEVLRLTRHGILKATICKSFPLASVKEAYRYLENRKNIGKIVVTVPDALMYREPPATQEVQIPPTRVTPKADRDARSVAIIGMSGKFAGAQDVNRFWDNLAAGKNSIRDVQAWRWDADAPVDLGAGDGEDDGIYWKRGGFLEDIDKFDPLFFNISPAEAEYMDPQQRLFLEESWKTLEDAGLAPETLSGRKCGVFVGVGKGDYLGARAESFQQVNANRLMGTAPAILAARISYLLNLTGPSIAVDTACSSSLVAIHQACQSIVSGECDMALAGGVCLMTTKELLVMAGKAGMLSPTGQCHTFDNDADGFVAGEGVGVLLLKSLPEAIRDGDNIHAVIRGGGFNQDGRTNGITAPSAKSQMKLEKEVYDRFAIDPGSISYVEAHGTGTKLGDPIEVSALSEVYRSYTDKRRYCAIGSVKTNIGHAMAAAGVASVIKVALALTRKQIPPSINFERENEHINFKDSPFFVNTELRDWTAEDGSPRRAAVSSFGFSGTNVHMVLDEYEGEYEGEYKGEYGGEYQGETTETGSDDGPAIFVLSAKSRERLAAYAGNMATFLGQRADASGQSLNLADIAYTSQVGREAMAHRLAVLATSVDDLRDKLERFTAGEEHIEGISCGRAERETDTGNGDAAADASERIGLWTSGASVDWQSLYKNRRPQRISLPTYPFERERYWMTDEPETAAGLQQHLRLHPLMHENTSDLNEQRFSTTFTGDEFFLADHLIGGKPMLPGAAYIEMARAAVVQSSAVPPDEPVTVTVKNVSWVRPVTVEKERVEVHISLFPEGTGDIAWEVWSLRGMNAERVVHSRGTAGVSATADPKSESRSGLEA
ncbi:MAG: polyketide synthase dehydratase domain-containing protein, partial [Desulfobacterales bacterium]|nr:polyketide synthase dehydratase domain-containing protein [Desulfobacterales bacterium]